MGEFAMYNGDRVKIGTCEEMYYLRADQAQRVRWQVGNVDPFRDAAELRFRFPFPDEDRIAPGAFENAERKVGLHSVSLPQNIKHDLVGQCALQWENVTCVTCLRWSPHVTHLAGPARKHLACHAGLKCYGRKVVDEGATCPKCAQIERAHIAAAKLPTTWQR
jgi:hypothetical protein